MWNHPGLSRTTLRVNATASAATGIAMIVGARPMAPHLGLDAGGLLVAVGAGLLAFAAAVYTVASHRPLRHRAVQAVSAADLGWVAGSLALVLADPGLSTFGTWAVLLVADAVLAFGLLQLWGLRARPRTAS